MQRDPSGMPAHHLDNQDPVVALGGGMEAVDRLGGDVQRGVEAEGHVGGAEIVVDRLRDPDHVQTIVVEALGYAERVLATNRDQPIEPMTRERLAGYLGAVLARVNVRARAPEDRSAA